MSDKSVQVNIRASSETASGLRAEARERRLPLGDLLAELLKLCRAEREPGLWLSLPDEVLAGLNSVAAARRETPEEVLVGLVRGNLRSELLQLAASLGSGSDVAPLPDSFATAPNPMTPDVSGSTPSARSSEAPEFDGLALHSRKSPPASSVKPTVTRPTSSPTAGGEASEAPVDEDLESVGIITVFD